MRVLMIVIAMCVSLCSYSQTPMPTPMYGLDVDLDVNQDVIAYATFGARMENRTTYELGFGVKDFKMSIATEQKFFKVGGFLRPQYKFTAAVPELGVFFAATAPFKVIKPFVGLQYSSTNGLNLMFAFRFYLHKPCKECDSTIWEM